MKVKFMKKMIATLCAVIMSISCFVSSVGAVDTTGAEIACSFISLGVLSTNLVNMQDFLDMSDYTNFDNKRSEDIKHKDETTETVNINEKKVYDEIYNTVQSLIDKVDERIPGNPKYKGKPSKNLDKPRNWRIAKAIYRWVAKNIYYDYEGKGGQKDSNGNSLRKPQDALFVFKTKQGVCTGYTDLIKVMMRMAKIPCACLSTLDNINGSGHMYNAVCLDNLDSTKGKNAKSKVWVLLDATHALNGEGYGKTEREKQSMKEYFPAFYSTGLTIREANRSMIAKEDHKIEAIYCGGKGDKVVKLFVLGNFALNGEEKNAYLDINNNNNSVPCEKIQIPDIMLKLGLKFKILKGIGSLILNGSEEFLDFSQATDLKDIDIVKSNKYARYDEKNKVLVYKKEYENALREKIKNKMNNEYYPVLRDYESVIAFKKIDLDSSGDRTAEARKKALDFVKDTYGKSKELTNKNVSQADDLINEAIKQMKKFNWDTLRTLLDDKIEMYTDYIDIINSLNSSQDTAIEAAKEAAKNAEKMFNNYQNEWDALKDRDSMLANMPKYIETMQSAIEMMDDAIKQIPEVKQGEEDEKLTELLKKKRKNKGKKEDKVAKEKIKAVI